MKLLILDLARDDLLEGYFFYEAQDTGLGSYFLSSLYADIESLKIYGGVHRKMYKGLHRALSKRFPFAIFYSVSDNTVWVKAIVDCRQHPSWIRRHLQKTD